MKPLALACLVASLPLAAQETPPPATPQVVADKPFTTEVVGEFEEPWAMTFLPDGRLLVTQKTGELFVHRPAGSKVEVSGVPEVAYGGQGGFGDVVLHPKFGENRLVYFSYVEAGTAGTKGAMVARAKLVLDKERAALEDVQAIWKQEPKLTGDGHFSHRIAFGPDGHLFISSGERQHFDPAQDRNGNLGRIVRLNDDGTVPSDNPHAAQAKGGVLAQAWTMGNRNVLGLAFDPQGRLWGAEMGPKGGDELNLLEAGKNYGYPIVSNGDHYDGKPIPDHPTRPEFEAPELWWTPVISPGGMIFYTGDAFADWKGDALIAGLSSQALVRVEFDGATAKEAARYPMDARIREVEQGPDGEIYLLEDTRNGAGGRLLKLTPKA